MSGVPYAVTLATALGCGLVAGVFFGVSSFIMPALKRLPPARGIAAMQSINVLAITPAFMTALFGTALACIGLGVWAALSSGDRPAALLIGGAAVYVIGTIIVTMAFNVPLNNRLEVLDAEDPEAARFWEEYLSKWTAWNHLRAAASLAAAAVLTIALNM